MNRLFLALLALFAGLAAQTAPAQARLYAGSNNTEIGSVQGLRGTVNLAANPGARLAAPIVRPVRLDRIVQPLQTGVLPALVPAVLIKADRAHE